MPKIDVMLQMMSAKNVERVVLTADQPYQVWAGGQRIERTVTPRAQLRAIIEEIVPFSLQSSLQNGGTFGFEHVCAYGTFDVGVSQDFGKLRVTLAPEIACPSAAPPTTPSLPLPPSPPPSAPTPIVPAPNYPPPISPPNFYPPPAHGPVQHVHHYHVAPTLGRSPRSRIVAGLLGLLLPGLGIHRFYLGYTGTGLCYLLMLFVFSWFTCGVTAWLAGIVGFIEGIIILCGGMNDAEGHPLSF